MFVYFGGSTTNPTYLKLLAFYLFFAAFLLIFLIWFVNYEVKRTPKYNSVPSQIDIEGKKKSLSKFKSEIKMIKINELNNIKFDGSIESSILHQNPSKIIATAISTKLYEYCPICYGYVDNHETLNVITHCCKMKFHYDHVVSWLHNNSKCPYCSGPFKIENIQFIKY